MSKPKLFIGSSVEGLPVAYAIHENLKFIAEVTVWDQGVFNLSESSLESLIEILEVSDFGVFVFSPDDHIKIRGRKDLAVRDNVLFELGLFVGKLGRKRSFIIMPDNKTFHLPTDLIGMTPGTYESDRSDKNMLAATGVSCQKIRDAISKQGTFNIVNEAPEISANEEPVNKKQKSDWFDFLYVEKKYDKAIELLKKKIRYKKDIDEKIHLKGFVCLAEFKKNPVVGTKEFEKLIQEYPTNNLSYLAYGNNLLANNSFKKCLEIADQGIKKCERKVYLTNLKASCMWAMNQKNEVIQLLSEAILNINDVSLYTKLCDYHIEMTDNKKAYNLLVKAYFNFPNNEEIIYKLAKVAYDVEQKDICIVLYKELLLINPDSSTYWCLIGNAYLDLMLYNFALNAYEKAESLSKESWIYANIGNLYNNKNLYEKAEIYLRKALEMSSESDYTHNRLSELYIAKEKETKKLNELMASAKTKLNLEILL